VYKRLPSITGKRDTVHVRQVLFRDGERKEIIYKSGQIGFAAMVTALSKDPKRNELLIDSVRAAVDRKKILIVTSIVDHAKFLADALQDVGALAIHGGTPAATVARAKAEASKVVVATYQFLEEGYDDPRIDTLVMALPRSKIQQVVGRCERTHEGKLVPLVLDIVDTFSVFEAMSWKRHHFYKSRGFTLTRV
jgi:superfamily II DNA or RNA helicase